VAEAKHNVVQAEFIFSELREEKYSLGAVVHMLSLELAGALQKLVVRFSDEDGFMTKVVQDHAKAEQAFLDACAEFAKMDVVARFAPSVQSDLSRAQRKMRALRGQARSLAVGVLGATVKSSREVAIEDSPDLPLRKATDTELDTLVEKASKASNIFVFVFEPNDLLADSNKLVGSISIPLPSLM